MMVILHDRIQIAKAINVEVISLNAAPGVYQSFDASVAKKFVVDPHNMLKMAS